MLKKQYDKCPFGVDRVRTGACCTISADWLKNTYSIHAPEISGVLILQVALLLYDDMVASAITDEAGSSGDFTSQLAPKLLDGEELSSDGITGLLKQIIPDEDEVFFADMPEEDAENLVVEPLTHEEPHHLLPQTEEGEADEDLESFQRSWDYWTRIQELLREEKLLKATRRSRKKMPESQLLLFGEMAVTDGEADISTDEVPQPQLFG